MPPGGGDIVMQKIIALRWTSFLGMFFAGMLPALTAISETNSASVPGTNVTTRTNRILAPGPNDGRIASVTAQLLEHYQFLQHPLDDEYSSRFLDRYIETLDPQHIHFTQQDTAEFEVYRTKLDDLTLGRKGVGDTSPAYKIFNRFIERLEQRTKYAAGLLKTNKFEFTTSERIQTNRKEAPYPVDMDDARRLWLQRLRYEYLDEKLALAGKTNSSVARAVNLDAPVTLKKSEHDEIVDTLTRRYNRNLHFFHELDNDEVLEFYLTSLAHVYDPHSDYMNKSQADNFAIGMSLSLFGIGAELSSLDGYCTINRLMPGGPAAKSKLIKDKDRIVAVAQSNSPPVDVVDMNLNKVVQMIRGPKGTEVRLTIVSENDSTDRRVISLVRDEIPLESQEAKARIIELPNGIGRTTRVGVIDLPSFYATIDLGGKPPDKEGEASSKKTPRSTSADVARLIKKFKSENVGGVILDLRRNGGGSLEEAIRLTGLFIKQGPVVQVKGPQDALPVVDSDEDPEQLYAGPLIVLTSRYSASASEILAGALQDYGRALIVGDISTHGKGTVQNLNPLRYFFPPPLDNTNDPGALKMTIRKFYRASGASTQKRGVMPDIVLPSVLNYAKDTGEASLETALEWDTIRSARYDKLNLVEPLLTDLLRTSRERVSTNQDFTYVYEDIELFRKRQSDKSISLNEVERRREKAEDLARKKARDREILAREPVVRTTYELTLKNVDMSGLPLPVGKSNTPPISISLTNTIELPDMPKPTIASAQIKAVPSDREAHTDIDIVSGTGDDKGSDSEPAPPPIDVTLEEAGRILVDYIRLLSQKGMITLNAGS